MNKLQIHIDLYGFNFYFLNIYLKKIIKINEIFTNNFLAIYSNIGYLSLVL